MAIDRTKIRRAATVLAALAVVVSFLAWNNVYIEPSTEEQAIVSAKFVRAGGMGSYEEELRNIAAVQSRVFELVRFVDAPAKGVRREIAEILASGVGPCFERGRFIEMALRVYGFEARRVAIYKTSNPLDLLYKSLSSHAMVEVKTSRGWLLVDTIAPWMALTADNAPISIEGFSITSIDPSQVGKMHPDIKAMLTAGIVHVYGLYSRHGYQHEPFIPFPDVNWGEFLSNLHF